MSVSVSIVVPVHNCVHLTRLCLDAVLAELPAECEVIVVDDASTDATPELLDGYGHAIRIVTLARNAGYASACNEGAGVAAGEALVFLNNDTEPRVNWLKALLAYADAHPDAAVVGAKLVYPTGVVQHAGVVIGQDGYPHNLYAGLPVDHPAVNRSRCLQAVTGACMLVRREAFEGVGGFDTGFLNSLEDVDLCLRIGEAGGEVHYCHEVEVTHLESASRGRLDRFERSVGLYRERWRERARRDDLAIYAEDGLIEVEYANSYPVRLSISPHLAVVDQGREEEVEHLLESYARQVSDLMGEVVRLTAALGEGEERATGGDALPPVMVGAAVDHRSFLREANRLEEDVRKLQQHLEAELAEEDLARPAMGRFKASRQLGYRQLVERVRAAVADSVPSGATVLVVSRGDRELVRIEDRDGRHFPQAPTGGYLGHHPRDGADAVAQLESLRAEGAQYLVLPPTAYWWLDHYMDFAEHLGRYRRIDSEECAIYKLGSGSGHGGSVREST